MKDSEVLAIEEHISAKNQQFMDVLIRRTKVSKNIATIRDFFQIPQNSFSKDYKSYEEWRANMGMTGTIWQYLDTDLTSKSMLYELYAEKLQSFQNLDPESCTPKWVETMHKFSARHQIDDHFMPYVERHILLGENRAPHRNHMLKGNLDHFEKYNQKVVVVMFGQISQQEWKLIRWRTNKPENFMPQMARKIKANPDLLPNSEDNTRTLRIIEKLAGRGGAKMLEANKPQQYKERYKPEHEGSMNIVDKKYSTKMTPKQRQLKHRIVKKLDT